jgi:outer membrane receptor for ferrienterochelin and colicins
MVSHSKTPDTAFRTGALGILLLTFFMGAGSARAQTLDYAAAKEIFGEDVTASVTGSPQRASDAPADFEIVTADEIRRSGAHDIPGVLSHVTGVDVLQWANDSADVAIHGYNQAYSPRTLVLIDGRQVYADYYGYTPWSALPVELSAIRQIEVVKGPNSALFGFNAVGGVINIITYDPLRDGVNTATLSAGTQGLVQASAVGTFKLGADTGVRVQIGGRRDDDFSTPIPAAFFGTRGSESRASIDVTGAMQLSDKLRLDIDLSHSAIDQNEVPNVYRLVNVTTDTNSVLGRVTLDSSLGLAQLQIYNNWLTDTFPAEASNSLPGKINNQVTVARVQDIFKLGSDHTLRGSFEYRHNTVSTTPIAGGHIFYDVLSAGAMWEWKITPDVTATNALRVDYLKLGRDGFLISGVPYTNASWDRSLMEPSFNSSLVWRSDDLDTFRVSASRGVQLPNMENFGGIQETLNLFGLRLALVGLPTIGPSSVTSFQAEWDRRIPSLNASLRVSLYHQTASAIISQTGQVSLIPSGVLVSPANIGDSRATGLDIELSGKFRDDWRWSVAYTPEIITDHFISAQIVPSGVEFQHTTPVHTVKASLGWSHGNWEADGFLRYESSSYGLTSIYLTGALAKIDGYVALDGRVAYKLTDRVTLSLSGQNLTQSSQRQTAGANVERRVVGGITVGF